MSQVDDLDLDEVDPPVDGEDESTPKPSGVKQTSHKDADAMLEFIHQHAHAHPKMDLRKLALKVRGLALKRGWDHLKFQFIEDVLYDLKHPYKGKSFLKPKAKPTEPAQPSVPVAEPEHGPEVEGDSSDQ